MRGCKVCGLFFVWWKDVGLDHGSTLKSTLKTTFYTRAFSHPTRAGLPARAGDQRMPIRLCRLSGTAHFVQNLKLFCTELFFVV